MLFELTKQIIVKLSKCIYSETYVLNDVIFWVTRAVSWNDWDGAGVAGVGGDVGVHVRYVKMGEYRVEQVCS